MNPPFDRLRFCISILFAQTTFRLSIDSKLPIVAYATAFDHFVPCSGAVRVLRRGVSCMEQGRS